MGSLWLRINIVGGLNILGTLGMLLQVLAELLDVVGAGLAGERKRLIEEERLQDRVH